MVLIWMTKMVHMWMLRCKLYVVELFCRGRKKRGKRWTMVWEVPLGWLVVAVVVLVLVLIVLVGVQCSLCSHVAWMLRWLRHL